jgi:hypothetical protein
MRYKVFSSLARYDYFDNRCYYFDNRDICYIQHSPSQAGYRNIDQQPISQQLITEDGQRISVDVNLRLISPAMGAEEVGGGYGAQHRIGMQYPLNSGRGEVCELGYFCITRVWIIFSRYSPVV